MKRFFALVALILVVMLICTGCSSLSVTTYQVYEHASDYSIGDIHTDSSKVNRIVIDWLSGSVDLKQSENGDIRISENGSNLKDDQRMHWYLDGKTLVVRFCASGYTGTMDDRKKALTAEIPYGVELQVITTSASVHLLEHSLKTVELATVSGSIHAAGITADSLSVSATSGSVEIEELLISGETDIGTVSGSVKLGRVKSHTLTVSTTSGRVTAGLSECENCVIGTVSGGVNLTGRDGFGAEVAFGTVSGKQNGSWKAAGNNTGSVKVSTVSGSLNLDEKE